MDYYNVNDDLDDHWDLTDSDVNCGICYYHGTSMIEDLADLESIMKQASRDGQACVIFSFNTRDLKTQDWILKAIKGYPGAVVCKAKRPLTVLRVCVVPVIPHFEE